jgi:type I restriction-modification system DNA methylase subunit
MKDKFKNTKTAIKNNGEVFTPTYMVNDILDKLPPEIFRENKTFLDNSCGNGQFLFNILQRKMENGFTHKEALLQIFGVELCPKNTRECRLRLAMDTKDPEIVKIIVNNIINADALDPSHPGWNKVGFYWSNQSN